jgi:epoxyqueuosine reductase
MDAFMSKTAKETKREISSIKDRIKAIISDENQYILGFADLRGLLDKKFSGHNYGIVIGMRLNQKIMDSLLDGPTREYFDHYHEINRNLSALAEKVLEELKANDVSCILIPPTVNDEELDQDYYKTLTCDFSHKMAATRAGLGWIGKTALFVSEKFGPRLRLITILVNRPLNGIKAPITQSRCGKCNLCVRECPAMAATGKLWDVNVKREEFYDAFKCREKCRELSHKLLNEDISLCGLCMAICPIGKQ